LQEAVKPGGYFIISDTPNRLWIREGHTTGIYFLNYLPFRLKCWLGSKSKSWQGKLMHDDYDNWIFQGIEGITYGDVYKYFKNDFYTNKHDLVFKNEYKIQVLNFKRKNILKQLFRYLLYIFAYIIDKTYLSLKNYPSLAISPSLLFSFRKKLL